MLLYKLTTSVIILAAPLIANAVTGTSRIESTYKDLGSVQKIYLSSGLFSVIEFPKPITEVIGQTKYLKVDISPTTPNAMTVFLLMPTNQPQNLIVRSEKRVYIFDIIPSRNTHQDYVKISGAFGGPSLSTTKTLLDSRELNPTNRDSQPTTEVIEREQL